MQRVDRINSAKMCQGVLSRVKKESSSFRDFHDQRVINRKRMGQCVQSHIYPYSKQIQAARITQVFNNPTTITALLFWCSAGGHLFMVCVCLSHLSQPRLGDPSFKLLYLLSIQIWAGKWEKTNRTPNRRKAQSKFSHSKCHGVKSRARTLTLWHQHCSRAHWAPTATPSVRTLGTWQRQHHEDPGFAKTQSQIDFQWRRLPLDITRLLAIVWRYEPVTSGTSANIKLMRLCFTVYFILGSGYHGTTSYIFREFRHEQQNGMPWNDVTDTVLPHTHTHTIDSICADDSLCLSYDDDTDDIGTHKARTRGTLPSLCCHFLFTAFQSFRLCHVHQRAIYLLKLRRRYSIPFASHVYFDK